MVKEISHTAALNKHAKGMIWGLVVQYLLGMASAFYVAFPDSGTAKEYWEFARNQILVVAHIVVGFALLFGTIVLVIRAFRYNDPVWKTSSLISFVAVAAAIIAGILFVPSQTDDYSFVMAAAFLIALLSLGWGMYQSKAG
jgi:heme/copper-type cytochrome/quinol oxidase subunit 2